MSRQAPLSTDSLATWLDYWANVHVTAIDLGLARVLPVAHALNILQPKAKVFTVAGTNGKGSTTSTLAQILLASGYKVALYQSPHIFQFNERAQLNGESATDAQWIDAFVAVENARQLCGLSLSFFEATTLAAFYIFQQQAFDIWILEIGLGGRLDVVNIIEPDVAVITNIGLDHVDWLGDTIEKIAFEKAGIIRENKPVIFAGDQVLPQAIADKAKEMHAPLYCYQRDYDFIERDQTWCLTTPSLTLQLAQGHLATINQAAAIMAILLSDVQVKEQHIHQGLQQAKLAGRFELRRFKDRQLVLDVGHNPHGIAFLLQQLAHYQQQNPQFIQIKIVFSMLNDKDIDAVVQLLTPVVKEWYIAPLDVMRAAPLAKLEQSLAGQKVHIAENIQQSLMHAITDSDIHDLILVCGSFHTLEAVWECLIHGNE